MSTAWSKYIKNLSPVMKFNEGYKKFLDDAKTEREAVKVTIALAEAKGYKDASKVKKAKVGDKLYFINRNKNIILYHVGKKPLNEGMNILGAHIDSPRLDLKQKPLYEAGGIALFDTHYYGGIKKYQWVATQLALHGVVCKKDGKTVEICIGEKDSDPVVGIGDLLPHLAADQMQKPAAKVIEGENLNICIGSIDKPDTDKDPVKAYILDLLKKEYKIDEDDFVSAEIEVVPATKARDYGLDRSMVIAYGQDDRVCAYTSLMGILDSTTNERTACCILCDKEEIGSVGATGMQSRFFEDTVAELLDKLGIYSEMNVRRTLTNSKMLSSDVCACFDPNFPEVFEKNNTAFLGCGLVFCKYTGARGKSGSNDANPEFIAQIRKVMDKSNVSFQTSELGRVDQGGGGTIAYIMGNMNMDVVDAGIALQSMHSLNEVCSKVDIYEGYRGYKAFLKDIK